MCVCAINLLADLSANKLRGAFPQIHVPIPSGTLVQCLKWLRVWGYDAVGTVTEHKAHAWQSKLAKAVSPFHFCILPVSPLK